MTAYDTVFVELAHREQILLATFDNKPLRTYPDTPILRNDQKIRLDVGLPKQDPGVVIRTMGAADHSE